MSTNSPDTSFGRRKSVNWAHPLSTVSTQSKLMSTTKRSSARFRGNKAPAINSPFSEIIQTDRETESNLEKKVDSLGGKCAEAFEETEANCVIAYCRNKGSGQKSKGPAASSTEPQLEPTCYSKDQSNSRMHKRARIVREEQLHSDSSIEAGKGWVSVFLDNCKCETLRNADRTLSDGSKSTFQALSDEPAKMTSVDHVVVFDKKSEMKPLSEQLHGDSRIKAKEGWVSVPLDNIEGEKSRNPDRNLFQDNKSSFKVLSNDPAKMTSLDCTDVFNQNSKMETMNETVDKELRDAHARSKKVVHDLEQTISKRLENKLQKLQSEKAKSIAIAALEQERLRDEITRQSQKHSKVIEEKLAIERDWDALKKDFSSKVAKELDSYRVKMDRDHAKVVATLTMELGREQEKSQTSTMELRKEQDKNLCQICFTFPRDAIVLPCLHFQYCNECLREHQRRQTECPTCRAMINGVIRCNFFAS